MKKWTRYCSSWKNLNFHYRNNWLIEISTYYKSYWMLIVQIQTLIQLIGKIIAISQCYLQANNLIIICKINQEIIYMIWASNSIQNMKCQVNRSMTHWRFNLWINFGSSLFPHKMVLSFPSVMWNKFIWKFKMIKAL